MSIALIIVIAGILIVVIAVVALTRRGSAGDAQTAAAVREAPAVLDDEGEAVIVPRDPEITWPTLLTPGAKFDDEARLRLIKDLALVRAPWCVPILKRACEEEQEPVTRQAAEDALETCEPGAATLRQS